MTTPRTVAGQAALSGMRPHLKRALGRTILAIETQAVAPYREALRELADRAERHVRDGAPGREDPLLEAIRKARALLAQDAPQDEQG